MFIFIHYALPVSRTASCSHVMGHMLGSRLQGVHKITVFTVIVIP